MCVIIFCEYPFSKYPGSHVDIDPRAMSRATRAYLREQHVIDVINEAQGVGPEDAPEVEEKCIDLIVRHPSMRVPSFPNDVDVGRRKSLNSDRVDRGPVEIAGSLPNLTEPLWTSSTRPSVNGRDRSPASLGSASSSGTRGRFHSSALDNSARHEDRGPVFSLSRERETSKNYTSNGAADYTTLPGDSNETWGDFCPHILHDPHDPVPIAVVNRWPTGSNYLFPWSSMQRELIAFCI
jgi:hypothetical protein